ncbi:MULTISPECIES: RagB/SusD family nutrient uptake outer membrane protein [unclassified Sphingobacterium]|uniref:RagB/SusD family nutrient uptake outer membrane protein n=1 Tax=unclassified Sphingobacterium TaxID=2609468 RepID=UPI0025D6B757|nr:MULTISPECIES: RagB/SusD family nutrient uptake outer membrane protein [unclassified Sphingobacterium]
MKKLLYILLFNLGAGTMLSSCSKSFLDENPLGFLATENGYASYSDFKNAVTDLYGKVRTEFYSNDDLTPFQYIAGCDFLYDGEPGTGVNRFTPMATSLNPTHDIPKVHWVNLYKIVSGANTIIDLAAQSKMTAEQQTEITAQAKFFRAFAYRTLGYLYGGVPLNLARVTDVKTDYTRASKAEVYAQCIQDLTAAVAGLKDIDQVADGAINKQAAQHLLAEVYLADKQYQKAVDLSSSVISSAKVQLMHNRFGAKSTRSDGNVYWDLFQPGNQNRKAGNMEGLWVVQFETDIPGGGASSSSRTGYALERQCAPYIAQIPNSTIAVNPFITPADDLTGGRGIGWSIPTTYFSETIWKSDFDNDIRNSNLNFVREMMATNPRSPYYGQVISTKNPPPGITVPSRAFYAYQAKCTTPGEHPANLFLPGSSLQLSSNAGVTYMDQYMFRLAETYLIRAEAYMNLNNPGLAANDINTVRARSAAKSVASSDVDIDLILDERLREFGIEEKRRLTLMRLGLLYDRVKRLNPSYGDVLPKYNVWPIPQSEIDANPGLIQNEGY